MKSITKKLVCILLSAILMCASAATSFAESGCHWYIKRNGTDTPGFPAEAEKVSENGGYYIGNTEEKRIYLTFDAGYENGNIARILDTLKEEKVPAAFFLLDNIILKNTDLVIRMANEGHLVCNHTRNHKDLSHSDKCEIAESLSSLEEIYREKTGNEMSKYFRFPEGKFSLEAMKCISELGYKTVFWSFGYDDWDNCRQPDREKAMRKILDNTHNGAIILLHPTSKTNADIMPALIREWRNMGYTFGTLDELTA